MEVTENALLRINGSLVAEPDIYETTPRYDSDVTYPLTLADASILSSATPARVRPTAAGTACDGRKYRRAGHCDCEEE